MNSHSYLSISIPIELQQYTKVASIYDREDNIDNDVSPDFGVKLIKDEQGNLTYAAYYSDTGDLLKKIFYDGSTVSSIEHYRYNLLYSQEKYAEGKITKKTKYDKNKKPICLISYEYNRKDQITAIRKIAGSSKYEIEYGYDELMRVNGRVVKVNDKKITEQYYRYDILDRIVEYKDDNQIINVLKLNPKNELLSYTITDKIGNTISIVNKYMCSEYIGTEVDLNGHKTTLKDKSYVDNVMLKKPFTSDDDLDLVISKMLHKSEPEPKPDFIPITKRQCESDMVSSVINSNLQSGTNKPLPISMRKLQLLQKS